jgi:hypothetical protein
VILEVAVEVLVDQVLHLLEVTEEVVHEAAQDRAVQYM